MRVVIIGALDQEIESELMFVALFSLKMRNVESVIIKYMSRVRRVREGLNCKTRIIHPR